MTQFQPAQTLPDIPRGEQTTGPFDVWAKRWDPDTDTFQWRRFTDCHRAWRDRKPELLGVSDGWRPVYWVAIERPAEAA